MLSGGCNGFMQTLEVFQLSLQYSWVGAFPRANWPPLQAPKIRWDYWAIPKPRHAEGTLISVLLSASFFRPFRAGRGGVRSRTTQPRCANLLEKPRDRFRPDSAAPPAAGADLRAAVRAEALFQLL